MNRLFFFVGLLMILNTTNEIKLEFPNLHFNWNDIIRFFLDKGSVLMPKTKEGEFAYFNIFP
jgi:hypothetical protein